MGKCKQVLARNFANYEVNRIAIPQAPLMAPRLLSYPSKRSIMAEHNLEVISALNDLIETCKDAEEGFRAAAGAIGKEGDPELKTLFNLYAQQRARFAAELQNEVLHRGGDPTNSGHVSAAFHRGWVNLKTAVTRADEAAIIAECEASEGFAMRNYENAMKKSLPSDLMEMVETQYDKIRLAHERVRLLERAAKSR